MGYAHLSTAWARQWKAGKLLLGRFAVMRGLVAGRVQRAADPRYDAVPGVGLGRRIFEIDAAHWPAITREVAAAVEGLVVSNGGDREEAVAYPAIFELAAVDQQVPIEIRPRGIVRRVRKRIDGQMGA